MAPPSARLATQASTNADKLSRLHVTTEATSHPDQPTRLAGQKRPRRQRQHSQSSSDSDTGNSDNVGVTSDNAEGLKSHCQRPGGRRLKKRPKLVTPSNPSSQVVHATSGSLQGEPLLKGKKKPTRKLLAPMDWNDCSWEAQKMHPGCTDWVAVNKGRGAPDLELRRHIKDKHAKMLEDLSSVSLPQWTQLVGVGKGYNILGGKGSGHYFIIPDSFQPPTENIEKLPLLTSDPAAPSTDKWAASLGWEVNLEESSRKFGSHQKVVNKLQDLVALPSLRWVSTAVGLSEILERGLLSSNKLNLSYLEDAAIWVSQLHGPFRAHFSTGGKPFQQLVQYYKYQKPLFMVEAFIIRSIHDKLQNHPGQISILHSKETSQAGLLLYKYLLSNHSNLDPEELISKKHDLFLAILQAGKESEKMVACPLSQVLLADSLLSNGQWRKASMVQSSASAAMWCLRAIVAHWCWLTLSRKETYMAFVPEDFYSIPGNALSIELPTNPDQHKLEVEDDPGDEEDAEDEEDEDSADKPPPGSEAAEMDSVGFKHQVEETLHRISQELDLQEGLFNVCIPETGTGDENPEATKFKSLALTQSYLTTKDRPAHNHINIWSSENGNVPAIHPRVIARKTESRQSRDHTGSGIDRESIGGRLKAGNRAITRGWMAGTFPFSDDPSSTVTLYNVDDIPVHRLTDDFSSLALQRQPQNVGVLQPLISEYWRQLLAESIRYNGKVTRVKVDEWLEKYNDCYSSAAAAMILNAGGIHPFSFKHYCYDGAQRNIFLLENGLLSFSNPVSSHQATDSHLDLAIMPADMTCGLLVLITILLPIANKLRRVKGQFLPFQSTHLWILPRRHTNGKVKSRYNSNDVNKKLNGITKKLFNVAINGEVILKMVHQVFSSEFPLLFENTMHLKSLVDVVAQHTWATGIYHYGNLGHFPPHPSLIGDRPSRHTVHCEVWHALSNTGPIHESWRPMVQGTSLFPERTFPEDALYVARRLVLTIYKLKDTSQSSDRAELVKNVMTAKPFLRGILSMNGQRSMGVVVGDHVLHVIIRTLILGIDQLDSPIPKITEIHIADSVVLLLRALCEWASGDFMDLSISSVKSALHIKTVRSRLLKKMTENEFQGTNSFEALQVAVSQAETGRCQGQLAGLKFRRANILTSSAWVVANKIEKSQ
ncbi:hypothetical protein BJV77DRAFT_964401 [Russula vinacea]|nr:hypothetical protein BJV77DRAFT_964401 [Russula vinacea]